ncbi:hypothetical protein C8R44DRAFT_881418 [Mycena epipterygia]|nr:hypothetical protein C8R44DRAFT_881418 [Mycena epipterygia]
MPYNAAHAFLSLFVHGARQLWPDFDTEFKAAGGRLVSADLQTHYSGVLIPTPFQDYPVGRLPDTLVMRRPNAQKVLHRLLVQHPTAANISLLAGTVRGVAPAPDMTSIQSLVVRTLDGTQVSLNEVAIVAGTLVLAFAVRVLNRVNAPDCTGSTQARFRWLQNAGFSLAQSLRCSYSGNLRYATVCFAVPPELEILLPIPSDKAGIRLLLSDCGHAELPRSASDVGSFLSRYGGQVPIPAWVLETVAILCERGNPQFDNIKIPTQSYVRYHEASVEALPSNFIAIGDANLKLNPIYGDSARLHDYGTAGCVPMDGETKDTDRLARRFELKLISAATHDAEVASALWHVRHVLAADRILLRPAVLWKILWTRSRF